MDQPKPRNARHRLALKEPRRSYVARTRESCDQNRQAPARHAGGNTPDVAAYTPFRDHGRGGGGKLLGHRRPRLRRLFGEPHAGIHGHSHPRFRRNSM